MTPTQKERLTSFTHDLFLLREYRDFVRALPQFEQDRWYSVIVELDRVGAPVAKLNDLGSDVYRAYVFRCFKSPGHSRDGELKILFCQADGFWHSLIGHRPGVGDVALGVMHI